MADKEKRIKLGVDVGDLANQLIQINRLTEESYSISVKGQREYNALLDESLTKLSKKLDFLREIGNLSNQKSTLSDNDIINNKSNEGEENNIIEKNISFNFSDLIPYFDNLIDNQKQQNNLLENLKGDSQNESVNQNDKPLDEQSKKDENSSEKDILNILDELKDPLLRIADNTNSIFNKLNLSQTPSNKKDREQSQESEEENTNKDRNNDRNSIRDLSNQTARVAVQKNDVYMAAALAAAIPVVGQGVSMVLQRLISAGENYDIAQHRYRATSGREGMSDFTMIGLSDTEAYEKQAQYIRDNVRLNREDLYFEKGFGLDSGTISSLLRSIRSDQNQNISSSRFGAEYLGYLRTSIDEDKVRGYSDEYLKVLVDLNQRQLEVQGETNTSLNSKIIAGIAGLSDAFQNPTVLINAIDELNRGLTNAVSPQVEALQWETASRLHPEYRTDQIIELIQNPWKDTNYISNFVKSLADQGYGSDRYINVSKALFGGKMNDYVRKFTDNVAAGQLDNLQNQFKQAQGYNIEEEATEGTSNLQRKTAKVENVYAQLGLPIAEGLGNLTEKAITLVSQFTDLASSTGSLNSAFMEFASDILGLTKEKKLSSEEKKAADFYRQTGLMEPGNVKENETEKEKQERINKQKEFTKNAVRKQNNNIIVATSNVMPTITSGLTYRWISSLLNDKGYYDPSL